MSICILLYQFDQAPYSELGNTCPTQPHVWDRTQQKRLEVTLVYAQLGHCGKLALLRSKAVP
jgi:hypothetical protein